MYRLNSSEEARREEIVAGIDKKIAQNYRSGYTYPKNNQEYWKTIDDYWSELIGIIIRFVEHDPLKFITLDEYVSGLEKMRRERNTELVSFFHTAWGNSPDHGSIHGIPGWNVLCDLCSEDYLAFEYEN